MTADLSRENNLLSWSRQGVDLAGAFEAIAVAQAAAASAAASALEAQAAAGSVIIATEMASGTMAFRMCPAGVTPDRGTDRSDVAFIWFSPSPPSTAAGKMLPGVDFWCVLGI